MSKIEFTSSQVQSLCIKNNWFTGGDISQYSKMLHRVDEGAEIEEIATMIWICSENADKEEIVKQLTPPPINKDRVQLVRAMETLARAVNDENVFMRWLTIGVADGDIKQDTEDEELEFYTQDEVFSELMDTFLDLMSDARKKGGLYCDNMLSKSE